MANVRKNKTTQMQHRLREGVFLMTLALAVFLFLSLFTYSNQDPGWSGTGVPGHAVINLGGKVGAFIADVFLSLFGITAYFFPFILLFSSWLDRQLDAQKHTHTWVYQGLGWACFLVGFSSLAGFYFKG